MFKLHLSLCVCLAICLAAAGAGAASLDWPANLVALSTGKSSQLLPLPLPVTASEESVELATESSAPASAGVPSAAVSSAELELEQPLPESASDAADDRLVSAVPISVPLPLIVAARTGLRSVLTIQEPTLAKLGEVVEHVPTAVSHQSQTVVHDHQRLVTPIVAPAVRTTQLVRQQPPLLWTLTADPRVLLIRN